MTDLRAINEDGEVVALPGAAEISTLRKTIEALDEEVERLEANNRALFRENRTLRARNTELTGKRNSAKELDAFNEGIEEVYAHFRKVLAPLASDEVGEKRWAVVRARLAAGFTVEQLKQAINGADLVPKDFDGRKNMTKLEYICRHPDHVESFIDDYRRQKTATDSENFSTEPVENVTTPTPYIPEVLVPAWPVECARRSSKCSHTTMLRGAWWVWQAVGMSGCPGCGHDVQTPDGRRSEPYEWNRRPA